MFASSLAFGDFAIVVVGLIALWKCGDLVVRYAIEVAEAFNVSTFFLGFVVLALAADAPEIAIAFSSALSGVAEVSVGDIIGGNFTDIALVIGLTLLLSRGRITIKADDKKNLLAMLGVAAAVIIGVLCLGSVNRWQGLALIILYVVSLVWLWKTNSAHEVVHENVVENVHSKKDLMLTSKLGLVAKLFASGGLIMGASCVTVHFALKLAQSLHWSPETVGAAILGVGTSLPELALSMGALRRGEYGLALGPTLGTVLGQTTLILGITALFSGTPVSLSGLGSSIAFMFAAFAIIVYGLINDKVMGRGIGAVLLALFFSFLGFHAWA